MTDVAHSWRLEILGLAAIALFLLLMYLNPGIQGSAYAGTDSLAAEKISGSSVNATPTIQPLIPQWVPPSAEVESTLFSLQAAIGGIFIGGVFGYWIGLRKKGGE
jgi:cobalt/nickel transport protein